MLPKAKIIGNIDGKEFEAPAIARVIAAISGHNLNLLKFLIEEFKVDINTFITADSITYNLLTYAIFIRVDYLNTKREPSLNTNFQEDLSNNLALIRYLLEMGINLDDHISALSDGCKLSPLDYATKTDNLTIVSMIIKEIEKRTSLLTGKEEQETRKRLNKALIQNALVIAISKNSSLDIIASLLTQEVENPEQLLLLACNYNNFYAAEKLLNIKMDLNQFEHQGLRALHYAAMAQNPKLVQLLTQKGAKVDVVTTERVDNCKISGVEKTLYSGTTPLMLAFDNQDLETIKILLDAKANINHRNDDEITILSKLVSELALASLNLIPMDPVESKKKVEMIQFVINRGAKLEILLEKSSVQKGSYLMAAIQYGLNDIAYFLEKNLKLSDQSLADIMITAVKYNTQFLKFMVEKHNIIFNPNIGDSVKFSITILEHAIVNMNYATVEYLLTKVQLETFSQRDIHNLLNLYTLMDLMLSSTKEVLVIFLRHLKNIENQSPENKKLKDGIYKARYYMFFKSLPNQTHQDREQFAHLILAELNLSKDMLLLSAFEAKKYSGVIKMMNLFPETIKNFSDIEFETCLNDLLQIKNNYGNGDSPIISDVDPADINLAIENKSSLLKIIEKLTQTNPKNFLKILYSQEPSKRIELIKNANEFNNIEFLLMVANNPNLTREEIELLVSSTLIAMHYGQVKKVEAFFERFIACKKQGIITFIVLGDIAEFVLKEARKENQHAVVKAILLLEDVATREESLRLACFWGYSEIITELLSRKPIDINARDSTTKNTALHSALRGNTLQLAEAGNDGNHSNCVRLLCETQEIDFEITDRNGETAWDVFLKNIEAFKKSQTLPILITYKLLSVFSKFLENNESLQENLQICQKIASFISKYLIQVTKEGLFAFDPNCFAACEDFRHTFKRVPKHITFDFFKQRELLLALKTAIKSKEILFQYGGITVVFDILWEFVPERIEYINKRKQKEDKKKADNEYQINQERKAAKQNVIDEINRCNGRMKNNKINQETLSNDIFKEYQEHDLMIKMTKCLKVLKNKGKRETLKIYHNGKKDEQGQYKVNLQGKIDVYELSIQDRFKVVQDNLATIEVVQSCFDFIQEKLIDQINPANEKAVTNLLDAMDKIFEDYFSKNEPTKKRKTEVMGFKNIIVKYFIPDIEDQGKSLKENIEKFFTTCKENKSELLNYQDKLESVIKEHYDILSLDRTQGLFTELQDFFKNIHSDNLLKFYEKMISLVEELMVSLTDSDRTLFEALKKNIFGISLNKLKEEQNEELEQNEGLEETYRRSQQFFRQHLSIFKNDFNKITEFFTKLRPIFLEQLSQQRFVDTIYSEVSQIKSTVDLKIDRRLQVLYKIMRKLEALYEESLNNLHEISAALLKMKERINDFYNALNKEENARLREIEKNKEQAQQLKRERKESKKEERLKKKKQGQEQRQNQKLKDAVENKKTAESMGTDSAKPKVQSSLPASNVKTSPNHNSGTTRESYNHFQATTKKPTYPNFNNFSNLYARTTIKDDLGDLQEILTLSCFEKKSTGELKETHELNKIESRALIYAMIFLTSRVMDKIFDTNDRALFSTIDAENFRNMVPHNHRFRQALMIDLHVLRDLTLNILSYLNSKLAGQKPSEEELKMIQAQINSLMLKTQSNSTAENNFSLKSNNNFVSNNIKTCKQILDQGIFDLDEFETYEGSVFLNINQGTFYKIWSNAHALIYSILSAYRSEYLAQCREQQNFFDPDYQRIKKQFFKYQKPGNLLRHNSLKPSFRLISELRDNKNPASRLLHHKKAIVVKSSDPDGLIGKQCDKQLDKQTTNGQSAQQAMLSNTNLTSASSRLLSFSQALQNQESKLEKEDNWIKNFGNDIEFPELSSGEVSNSNVNKETSKESYPYAIPHYNTPSTDRKDPPKNS